MSGTRRCFNILATRCWNSTCCLDKGRIVIMRCLLTELNCWMPLTDFLFKDYISGAASHRHCWNLDANAKYLWKSPKVLAIVISAFWQNMLESTLLDFGKSTESYVFSHASLILEVSMNLLPFPWYSIINFSCKPWVMIL